MTKRVIKTIVFIVVVVLVLSAVSVTVISKSAGNNDWNNNAVINGIYNEPKDSIDVLFLGSSRVAVGFSPMYLWKTYGFTSYVLGTRKQQPSVSELLLTDTYERQHYKAVVYDVTQLFERNEYASDAEYYDADQAELTESFQSIPFSLNKLNAAIELTKKSSLSIGDLMVPLYRFHDRWTDLSRKDFKTSAELKNKRLLHGQEYMTITRPVTDFTGFIDKGAEKTAKTVSCDDSIIDMIKFCKEKGIALILTRVPSFLAWTAEDSATIQKIADEYGVPFIDYMRADNWTSSGMDISSDFLDSSHFNCEGAEAVSALYGDYLKKNLSLPDKRQDSAYSQWNDDIAEYDKLVSYADLTTITDPTEYFKSIDKSGNFVMVSVDGEDYNSLMTDEMQKALISVGLARKNNDFVKDGAMGYIACIDNGKVVKNRVVMTLEAKNTISRANRHVTVRSHPGATDYTVFAVDNLEEVTYPLTGVHVLVYNKQLEKEIDSVTFTLDENGAWVAIRS